MAELLDNAKMGVVQLDRRGRFDAAEPLRLPASARPVPGSASAVTAARMHAETA